MMKYSRWTVWPCLCGYAGPIHQIRHHMRKCEVWKARDKAAVRYERSLASREPRKELANRCPHCKGAPSHHKPGCPGWARLRQREKLDSPALWAAFLNLLRRRYDESGRGAMLLARFD